MINGETSEEKDEIAQEIITSLAHCSHSIIGKDISRGYSRVKSIDEKLKLLKELSDKKDDDIRKARKLKQDYEKQIERKRSSKSRSS